VAVASAGPYASLHLAADRQPHQHLTTQVFFTGRLPFLPPNQQRQELKALLNDYALYKSTHSLSDVVEGKGEGDRGTGDTGTGAFREIGEMLQCRRMQFLD